MKHVVIVLTSGTRFMMLCIIFILVMKNKPALASDITNLLKVKPQYIQEYDLKGLESNQVYFEMDFGNAKIKNPALRKKYSGRPVISVELIYTHYKLSETFLQPDLNQQRLVALKKLSPEIFESSVVSWKFIAQRGNNSLERAKTMFHGFVITYLPAPTSESLALEAKAFDIFLKNDSLGKEEYTVIHKPKLKRKRVKSGMYKPVSKYKRKKGILYPEKGIWNRRPHYITRIDTLYLKDTLVTFKACKDYSRFLTSVPDSVVLAVLNRNQQWKNILFICDVTGSMAPYSGQLLVWHKLNYETRRAAYFTFFNDGDNKPDNKKRIGSTGGIYHVEASGFKEVENTAKYTMSKGGGGDGLENNIEATLEAINKFPEASEIVMIADNYANIKDISLLKEVRKPIHVILCGAWTGVNVQYLKLALETGGSVHTIEEDIEMLSEFNEGKKIVINKQTYIIKNKEFVRITDM